MMVRAQEVRAARLRTIMQHALNVKSRKELFDFCKSRFGVTNATANDYIDTVIEHLKRMKKKK